MPSLGPQKQRVTEIGHQTTIETALGISKLISKAGNKRTPDQLYSVSEHCGVSTILPARANQSTRNDFPLSVSTSQSKQLRASEIKDVNGECSRLVNGSSIYSQRRAIAPTPPLVRNLILTRTSRIWFAREAHTKPLGAWYQQYLPLAIEMSARKQATQW